MSFFCKSILSFLWLYFQTYSARYNGNFSFLIPPLAESLLLRYPQNSSRPLMWLPLPSLYSPSLAFTIDVHSHLQQRQCSFSRYQNRPYFQALPIWRSRIIMSLLLHHQPLEPITLPPRHKIPNTGVLEVPLPRLLPPAFALCLLFFHCPPI